MKYVAYHYSLNNIEIGTSIPPRMYESFMGKKALIEECLEKFRKDNCPQCHTRLNCVFLAPSEDSAKEWCKRTMINHWRMQDVEFYVYCVEIDTLPIWYDSDILMEIYYTKITPEDLSKKYWNSASLEIESNTDHLYECMVSTDVRIVGKSKWYIDTNGNCHSVEV